MPQNTQHEYQPRRSQSMYDDAEDVSNPDEITAIPTTPFANSTVDLDGEMAAEYSEESTTQIDLTQLQEHFKSLHEKFDQLGTAMNMPAHTEEHTHLTDKLLKLVLTLHPHPTDRPMGEPIHTAMQQYTDTLCATQQ